MHEELRAGKQSNQNLRIESSTQLSFMTFNHVREIYTTLILSVIIIKVFKHGVGVT